MLRSRYTFAYSTVFPGSFYESFLGRFRVFD